VLWCIVAKYSKAVRLTVSAQSVLELHLILTGFSSISEK
jgi:hypothetical protein